MKLFAAWLAGASLSWSAQYGYNDIVNTTAHGGSQSFRTIGAGGGRPFELPPYSMDVSYSLDFWLQTWV